jgi:hypothetical protein
MAYLGGFDRDASGALIRGSLIDHVSGGFNRGAAEQLGLSGVAGTEWQGGFVRDPGFGLLRHTNSTVGASWQGGHLRAPDGSLVITAIGSAVLPVEWSGGFVRDAAGRLLTT